MKTALLVVDVQKAFFEMSDVARKSLEEAVTWINMTIPLFRAKGLPVVWVQHIDEEDGVVPGAEGFDLPETLKPLEGDLRIHKRAGSAFHGTNLEQELRDRGVDAVVVTGFCAEFCVLSTIRGARDLGFTEMLLRGTLASVAPENIPFVERVNEMVTGGVLAKMLADS